MTEATIWLDKLGDADVPEGAVVVDSEADFLRCAIEETRLLVRGERLCEWASQFYRGRNVATRETHSPIRTLQRTVPDLTVEQARELLDYLGTNRHITREFGLTPRRLLETLYPMGAWSETPSRSHAAEWLRWLYLEQPTPAVQAVLFPVRQSWRQASIEPERALYDAANRDAAQDWLVHWLGIIPRPGAADLGEFPAEVPAELVVEARRVWRTRVIETEGAFFDQQARRSLPRRLLRVAAEETADYLLQHPQYLTPNRLRALAPLLDAHRRHELARLAPPPSPAAPPETAPELLHWFESAYLPWRRWQTDHGGEEDAATAARLIRCFADWYLAEYPRALTGGVLREHLSFRQPLPQRADDPTATLVVILDGLHAEDALHLRQKLEDVAPRLQLLETRWVFSTLPTVTEFAKPSVLAGLAPTAAARESDRADVLPERADPVKWLTPGQAIFWRVMDPDRTYHERNTDERLLLAIDGALHAIALRIAAVVRDAPAGLPLRIVLATDHGRLLDRVPRTIPIPAGMTAHGRAAWGQRHHSFDASGLLVEGDVAFLHGERFGLPEEVGEVAVILGAQMFKTNDNRSGGEAYPHGGISPEEIVVPWWVLERDWQAPVIPVNLSGRAVAGRKGQATVHIVNTAEVTVTLAWITLQRSRGTSQMLDVNLTIGPRAKAEAVLELDPWPTPAEADELAAEAAITMSSGKQFAVEVDIALASEEMYGRDNILEDLL